MGKKRRHGQRTFNPLDRPPKDIGKEFMDSFDESLERMHDVVRQSALSNLRRYLEEGKGKATVGEAILGSLADACSETGIRLRVELTKAVTERERKKEVARELQAEAKQVTDFAESAASAAFPGVKEDDNADG